MEQKQVTLIGLKAEKHGIIKAAELTPDLLSKRLVLFTGNVGNGKSTLIDMVKVAVTGSDAIKKKDILEKGYLAEAQLLDGDIKLFVGSKVSEFQRGDKAGEPKFETFLYAKDDNGKPYQPIIDGVAATPSDYVKMLTTELTSSLPDLFSENPTTHRKLLEKLFKPELDKLKVDEVIERIEKAKKERDVARTLCQGNGAFKERFEDEGYNENALGLLKKIDITSIEKKISDLKVERGIKLNGSDSAWELEKNKIDTTRDKALQAIKDEALRIKDEIAKDLKAKEEKYNEDKKTYDIAKGKYLNKIDLSTKLRDCNDAFFTEEKLTDEQREALLRYSELGRAIIHSYKNSVPSEPIEPQEDETLKAKLYSKRTEYVTLEKSPLTYPEKGIVDVSDIDKNISQLETEREGAEANNAIYNRYQLWLDWIAKKGIYEKEIDTLRKLYASVDTGVQGMNIVPRETESGRVEVFIMYNGEYDTTYFNNANKEHRMLFEYSSFQRTIIGLMLQAARLNLKPKALRIAFVDDVAFTQKDVAVLQNIAEKLDLRLITAWTHEVERESLIDGQVMIEGGEVFFN